MTQHEPCKDSSEDFQNDQGGPRQHMNGIMDEERKEDLLLSHLVLASTRVGWKHQSIKRHQCGKRLRVEDTPEHRRR